MADPKIAKELRLKITCALCHKDTLMVLFGDGRMSRCNGYPCVIPGCPGRAPCDRAIDHGRLCDEHYTAVSEARISAQIKRLMEWKP